MLRFKHVFCVIALMAAMTMATGAFAQVTFNASSTPTSRAIRTNHTALVGTVTLTQPAASGAAGTAGGTLTIDLPGVQITNTVGFPAGNPIAVVGSGVYAGVVFTVNNVAGTIVITMPALGAGVGAGDAIVITGVRVSLDSTTFSSLNASLSASAGSGYLITAGQNTPTVISSILDGLIDSGVALSGAQPGGRTFTVLSNGLLADGAWQVDITENFIDALETVAQLGAGSLNDVNLLMTFSGLPTGVTLGIAAGAITVREGGATIGAVGAPAVATTVSNTANTVTVSFTGGAALSLTAISSVRVVGTVAIGATASIPLTPGNVTLQVTLAPTGSALGTGGVPLTTATTPLPRFQATQIPSTPLVIGSIIAAQTNLLVPFAVSNGLFDTGMAIANTTADNFAVPNGSVPQSGTILFEFWPQTGTPFTYTTSATSPGTGLTSGSLSSGGTYSVLLSELLTAAGGPAEYTGYIIVTTNFTNGHGNAFVTDFTGFTSATDILVIPPPDAGNPRLGIGGEGLGK